MNTKNTKSQRELLSGTKVKTMTAEEAINIIETQFGVKLLTYQKLILKILWRKSHEKDRPVI